MKKTPELDQFKISCWIDLQMLSPGGQFELIGESKSMVYMLQEVQSSVHLIFDLECFNFQFQAFIDFSNLGDIHLEKDRLNIFS